MNIWDNSAGMRELAAVHGKDPLELAQLLWKVCDMLELGNNRGMPTEELVAVYGEDVRVLLDLKLPFAEMARNAILFYSREQVGRGRRAFLYGGWGVRKTPYWREVWCRSWGWHWDFVQDYRAQVEKWAYEENADWNERHGYKPLTSVGDMTDVEVMRTFLEVVQGEHKDPVTKETLDLILVQLRKMLRHAKGDW